MNLDIKGQVTINDKEYDNITVSGKLYAKKSFKSNKIYSFGMLECDENIYSKEIQINGMIKTKGDVKCEVLNISGGFVCKSIFSKNLLDICFDSDCHSDKIETSILVIKKDDNKINNVNISFFKKKTSSTMPFVFCDEIKCDKINAENLRANKIICRDAHFFGDTVIDELYYIDKFDKTDKVQINKIIKINSI